MIAAEAGYSLRDGYHIDSLRTVFLFFGVISPRKGADVLLKALRRLSPDAAAQGAFIFCGEPEHGYREAFEQAYVRLHNERPDIQLHREDRFVSDERMISLFEQSDVILMPYTRPEYSSGILALAAEARTPVIGPEGGLLGRLIRQNGLGTVCPVHPNGIAQSITDAMRRLPVIDETRCEAFVQRSRPDLYGRTILDALTSSNTIEYHGALKPLTEACQVAQADVLLVADLLRAPQIEGVPSDGVMNVLLRKAAVAIRHAQFVFRVQRLKKDQCMLIQEFSNIPLAMIFPFIWLLRDRLMFVVNHNLQWTVRRSTERAAFGMLGRMGCRFVFFEQIPAEALRELGITPKGCFALPHPVSATSRFRTRDSAIKRVGVIGQFRAEKGLDSLLEHLKPLSAKYDIMIGVPNREDFKRNSQYAGENWFELTNTAGPHAYRDALLGCDVIVLNHPASGYQFRASGLIADAAAAHVPVVVRRLPVLEAQISRPVRIGECFDDLSGLEDALGKVDVNLRGGVYKFEEYIQARSAQELAKILDAFTRKPHG